jgi:glycosyltransferase involved in cell wall biosynthesis
MVVVGRLSQEKGQADLIHAFIALSAAVSEPRLRLLLIGDGPDRPALEALAQPAGARIVFAGYSANPWPLFNAADIFVLPSHSEGSPLVVLEAMDAGLPIVATRVGGVPEVLIHEETALLVNPSEPAALRNALERLVRDPALRAALGRHARETLPRYSPESYVARLLGIYDAASRRVQNS